MPMFLFQNKRLIRSSLLSKTGLHSEILLLKNKCSFCEALIMKSVYLVVAAFMFFICLFEKWDVYCEHRQAGSKMCPLSYSMSNSFYWIFINLGHNNISPKMDYQLNCSWHSWITTLEFYRINDVRAQCQTVFISSSWNLVTILSHISPKCDNHLNYPRHSWITSLEFC